MTQSTLIYLCELKTTELKNKKVHILGKKNHKKHDCSAKQYGMTLGSMKQPTLAYKL